MKLITLFLFLGFASTAGFNNALAQAAEPIVVLVKYKTLPGKDSVALSALKKLIEQVKTEPNYVDINVLTDPADRSSILLYEKWSDESYYKGDHMKTAHLQQFMAAARTFLGGPPEITFWKIAKE